MSIFWEPIKGGKIALKRPYRIYLTEDESLRISSFRNFLYHLNDEAWTWIVNETRETGATWTFAGANMTRHGVNYTTMLATSDRELAMRFKLVWC